MAVDFSSRAQLDHFRSFTPGPAFTPALGVAGLAAQVRAQRPGGVNAILIGLMPAPGFKLTTQPNGIIAILIGLLLPAVQRIREPGSADLQALKTLLKPGGSICIAMGDGSVRVIAGPPMSFSAIR